MIFNTLNLPLCGEEAPWFLGLFDFSTAPPLLYYSYIPIIVISAFVGFYVFVNNRKSLQNRLLLTVTIFFVLWVVNILVQWVASYHTALLFAWQLTAILETGLFLSTVYFAYVFFNKKDVPFSGKVLLSALALGVIALTPTSFNVGAYDIWNCEGVNGILWNIIYALEPVAIVLLVYMGLLAYRREKNAAVKKQIALLVPGLTIFLAAFFVSNFYGELTGVYEFNLWGPLGMFAFLLLLGYTTVRFKTFSVKIFGAQVLIGLIWVLIGSLLFLNNLSVMRTIIAVTWIALVPFGVLFVRSVRREIEARQEIERLASRLADFISFATHELRGPIGNLKAALEMVMSGEYGSALDDLKPILRDTFVEAEGMSQTVDIFLNVNKIEVGKFELNVAESDMRELVRSAARQAEYQAHKQGVAIHLSVPEDEVRFVFDFFKMQHVVKNIIDNAIKYSEDGDDVTVKLSADEHTVTFEVHDTGIGMDAAVRDAVFVAYERGRAGTEGKKQIMGHGIGMWLSKKIVDLHGGTITAKSEGAGKGSIFTVVLPRKRNGKGEHV